jgi:hypothetical protein
VAEVETWICPVCEIEMAVGSPFEEYHDAHCSGRPPDEESVLRADEWERLGELEELLDDRKRIVAALEAFHKGPREFWRVHETAMAMYRALLGYPEDWTGMEVPDAERPGEEIGT